jgi:hypothetical protein
VDNHNTFAEQKSENLKAAGRTTVMTFKCSGCFHWGKNEYR